MGEVLAGNKLKTAKLVATFGTFSALAITLADTYRVLVNRNFLGSDNFFENNVGNFSPSAGITIALHPFEEAAINNFHLNPLAVRLVGFSLVALANIYSETVMYHGPGNTEFFGDFAAGSFVAWPLLKITLIALDKLIAAGCKNNDNLAAVNA